MDPMMNQPRLTLSEVYEGLMAGEITCEEAAKVIRSNEVQTNIGIICNMATMKNGFIDDTGREFLQMIILITQFIYNNSGEDTGIEDKVYDELYEIMLFDGGDDIISAPNMKNKKVVPHRYPQLRGTLKKTYYLFPDEVRKNPSRKYLDEWITSMENKFFNETGRKIDLNQEEIYVFPKFDGLSVVFEFDKEGKFIAALTRGDTDRNEAQDISHIFPKFKRKAEYHMAYGMKTEVMMSEDDLHSFNKAYGTNYKNSRSIVAAILNSDEYDPKKTAYLHVVPLRLGFEDGSQELASECLSEYPHIRCKLSDRKAIKEFSEKNKYVFDKLRCDGAVIYFINPEVQKVLGRENAINNFEVAYKFTEESAMTTLLNIDYQVGLFGKVTPIAKVSPVKLKGNTITSISLGSAQRMQNMRLTKGDKVKVLYDIIPYMVFDSDCEHVNGKPFEFPRFCPKCGNILDGHGTFLNMFCDNLYCECRIKGRILNYINKMGIENISFAALDTLYEAGFVTRIQDLYTIEDNKKMIVQLSGIGAKTVNRWIKSINEHMVVDDYDLLGSIGIPNIGRRIFHKICELYTMDEIIEMAANNYMAPLIRVPGIKDATASKILVGIRENLNLIEYLEDILTVIQTKGNSMLPRFSVCFTKVRDYEVEKEIKAMGGEIHDSLTKSTTYLVIPNYSVTSSKIEKAKKYGTTVMSLDEFKSKILKQ